MANALHFPIISRLDLAQYRFLTGVFISCGVLSFISMVTPARAQQGLADAMANDTAAQARSQQQQQLQDYTFKSGDFRMLVVPAMDIQWSDNINTSDKDQQSDVIVLPTVGLISSYPLTDRNVLQLNVTAGYSEYIDHNSLSTWYLSSGSGLSFDLYIKDILVNLHDQFSFVQDSSQNAAVANTSTFGTFQNSAGVRINWNLKKVVFTVGYDHQNVLSPSGTLSQVDHSAESADARIGYQWNPKLTTGVESSASYTAYDDTVLNNNTSYSIGVYGTWKPDSFLRITPRVGYVIDQFDQTSHSLRTSDQASWYADLSLSHDITRSLSYNLDVGRQTSLGVQSDVNQNYYANAGFNWNFIKGNRFTTSFTFQHGNQGAGSTLIPGASNPNLVSETYNWYGGSIGISHALTKRINLALNYRLTERSSSGAQRGYAENRVDLQISYHPL